MTQRMLARARGFALPVLFTALAVLFDCANASAVVLPPPSVSVTLPLPAANTYSEVAVTFGPTNGLMYVWTGAEVYRENAVNSSSFTSIATVGSGSSDPGPIAISRDASRLIVGNGAGGVVGDTHNGLIFGMPNTGSPAAITSPVGTVLFNGAFLAAPIGASQTKYFVDSGQADFSGSSVSIFDESTGSNVTVIQGIPGATTSIALDSQDRLYVGVGFGDHAGELHRFSLASLVAASTSSPLNFNDGEVFNTAANNSGAGMFFDAHGNLFVGGGQGVTVFDPQGNARLFDNGGYTTVTYDPANDRMFVAGFGNQRGLYAASTFAVPEPGSLLMALLASLMVLPLRRRLRRTT